MATRASHHARQSELSAASALQGLTWRVICAGGGGGVQRALFDGNQRDWGREMIVPTKDSGSRAAGEAKPLPHNHVSMEERLEATERMLSQVLSSAGTMLPPRSNVAAPSSTSSTASSASLNTTPSPIARQPAQWRSAPPLHAEEGASKLSPSYTPHGNPPRAPSPPELKKQPSGGNTATNVPRTLEVKNVAPSSSLPFVQSGGGAISASSSTHKKQPDYLHTVPNDVPIVWHAPVKPHQPHQDPAAREAVDPSVAERLEKEVESLRAAVAERDAREKGYLDRVAVLQEENDTMRAAVKEQQHLTEFHRAEHRAALRTKDALIQDLENELRVLRVERESAAAMLSGQRRQEERGWKDMSEQLETARAERDEAMVCLLEAKTKLEECEAEAGARHERERRRMTEVEGRHRSEVEQVRAELEAERIAAKHAAHRALREGEAAAERARAERQRADQAIAGARSLAEGIRQHAIAAREEAAEVSNQVDLDGQMGALRQSALRASQQREADMASQLERVSRSLLDAKSSEQVQQRLTSQMHHVVEEHALTVSSLREQLADEKRKVADLSGKLRALISV